VNTAIAPPRFSRTSLLLVLLLALAAAGLVSLGAKPALAGTDDYPSQWRDIAMDTVYDTWLEWNRECTSFAAFRLSSRNGFEMPFAANASNWKSRAQSLGYPVNSTPAVGAIAWTSTHVAWVEAVSGTGVTIEDYNGVDSNGNGVYGDDGTYSERTRPTSNFEYIHFKDLSGGSSASDGPHLAAAARSNGENYVYWRDPATGYLRESWYAGGVWYGPITLTHAGQLGSAPTVAIDSNGTQYVFWKGTNGHLWETWYSNGWLGPLELGMGTLGSAPTATAWGSQVDVFWKGTDGNLWEAYYAGGWHGSFQVPMGQLGSAPATASYATGEQDVFWKGTDGKLWYGYYVNGSWHGSYSLPQMGTLGSAPTVSIQPTSGQENVFWRGTDGTLRQAFFAGGSWYGPYAVGMTIGSTPAATAWANDVDVYWRCSIADDRLCQAFYSNGWYGPTARTAGPIPSS